jgi:signal transduction histidine kinase
MEPGQIVGQSALLPTQDVMSMSVGEAQLILAADVQRALGGETFTAVVEAFARVFELKYSPDLDSNGVLVGAIGIAVDASERRALDRRKDAFVSTVSHELRTPLNGVIAVSHEAIHTGHVNVEHDHGKVLREHTLERVRAGVCRHQATVDGGQGGLQCDNVTGLVVDHQNTDWVR